MNKKEAYKIVYDDLIQNELLIGKYDAENGSEDFMDGIWVMMEIIASNISDETLYEFDEIFLNNLKQSEDKIKKV